MKTLLHTLIALILMAGAGSTTYAAGCTGAVDCNICTNCKSCKHCGKLGGSCGVSRSPQSIVTPRTVVTPHVVYVPATPAPSNTTRYVLVPSRHQPATVEHMIAESVKKAPAKATAAEKPIVQKPLRRR